MNSRLSTGDGANILKVIISDSECETVRRSMLIDSKSDDASRTRSVGENSSMRNGGIFAYESIVKKVRPYW